jgi:hypothetical protein
VRNITNGSGSCALVDDDDRVQLHAVAHREHLRRSLIAVDQRRRLRFLGRQQRSEDGGQDDEAREWEHGLTP